MPDFGLGRIHVPDPRDADYPLRSLLQPPPDIKEKFWLAGNALDQGQEPWCVGFGWKDWLICEPVPDDPEAAPPAEQIYHDAQSQDGIPGPHDGSTVRAGAKVMQDAGRIVSYHWSQDANDVSQYLLGQSPLVIGINWTDRMFKPDGEHIIRYQGAVRGGHCVLLYGVDMKRSLVKGLNSWGAAWGDGGSFWLPLDDLDRLLSDNGEACAALEKKVAYS